MEEDSRPILQRLYMIKDPDSKIQSIIVDSHVENMDGLFMADVLKGEREWELHLTFGEHKYGEGHIQLKATSSDGSSVSFLVRVLVAGVADAPHVVNSIRDISAQEDGFDVMSFDVSNVFADRDTVLSSGCVVENENYCYSKDNTCPVTHMLAVKTKQECIVVLDSFGFKSEDLLDSKYLASSAL